MSSTYKGDSPGKKITRLRMWHQMFYFANWLNMTNDGILVLAGDGGDMSALDGWGIDHDKITAVDMEKSSVDKCRQRFPGMKVVHGSLGSVVKNPNVHYNMAHVDFCGGLTMPNINTLVDVINNADKSQPFILSITMLKGREYKRANGKMVSKLPRSLRKMYAKQFRATGNEIAARMMMNGPFEPRKLIDIGEQSLLKEWHEAKRNGRHRRLSDMAVRNAVTKGGKISYLGTCVSRMEVLRECLISRMIQEEAVEALNCGRVKVGGTVNDLDAAMGILQGGILGYHSRNGKQHGTPFVTMTFVIAHGIVLDLLCREQSEYDGHSYFNYGAATFGYYRAITAAQGELALRPFVAQYAKLVGTAAAAKVFDLPKGTVAAWLAHLNMGTYNNILEQLKGQYLTLAPREGLEYEQAKKSLLLGCEHWGLNFGPEPHALNLRDVYRANREVMAANGRSPLGDWDVRPHEQGFSIMTPEY
jgi:hypothetical protein